jgi:hypothetical protein
MLSIDPGDLDTWLGYEMNRAAPAALHLAPPGAVGERAVQVLAEAGVEVLGVHGQSGAVSFLLSGDVGIEPFSMRRRRDDGDDDLLVAACRAVDDRRYSRPPVVDALSATQPITELRSSIHAEDLPVIGPGGRMLLVDDRLGQRGELVVRTRTGEVAASEWRAPSEIVGGLVGRLPAAVELHVALGYFEASLRERQDWMRPVVMLVIDHTAVDEEDLSWRHVIVEPATHVADLRLDTGLELWFNPEGGFDAAS